MMGTIVKDKAGKGFWDELWEGKEIPTAANPQLPGAANLYTIRLDKFYRKLFAETETAGKSFLELGCGMSVWLPYFAREFGFKVAGVDYSEIGCQQERQILEKAGIAGEVFCADFFNPPPNLAESFDYVYSFGVAEHFAPTERCLSAFADFLKPGGTMITIIPNMTGTVGWMQKTFARSVYDVHVPLNAEDLRAAHEKAGLNVISNQYIFSTGFGLVNLNGLDKSSPATRIKKHLIRGLGRLSVMIWLLEDKTANLPLTKAFSPFIVCISRKAG